MGCSEASSPALPNTLIVSRTGNLISTLLWWSKEVNHFSSTRPSGISHYAFSCREQGHWKAAGSVSLWVLIAWKLSLPCLWPGQDKRASKGAKHGNDQNLLSDAGDDVFLFSGSPWCKSLTFLGKKTSFFFKLYKSRAPQQIEHGVTVWNIW